MLMEVDTSVHVDDINELSDRMQGTALDEKHKLLFDQTPDAHKARIYSIVAPLKYQVCCCLGYEAKETSIWDVSALAMFFNVF